MSNQDDDEVFVINQTEQVHVTQLLLKLCRMLTSSPDEAIAYLLNTAVVICATHTDKDGLPVDPVAKIKHLLDMNAQPIKDFEARSIALRSEGGTQ